LGSSVFDDRVNLWIFAITPKHNVRRGWLPKLFGKGDMFGMGKLLIPKKNDFPLEQCLSYLTDLRRRKRATQVNPANLSASVNRYRGYLDLISVG
jgi:hypothetical protein